MTPLEEELLQLAIRYSVIVGELSKCLGPRDLLWDEIRACGHLLDHYGSEDRAPA